MRTLSLIVVLFFTWNLTFSQVNNFKQWSVKDGLPQSTVYACKQDARGYIWAGTNNGLACFDGRTFKTYTKKEGLAGNTVRSLFIDSKQNIWIGTDGGISIYDGYTFKNLTKESGLSGSTVLCFLEDNEKMIWAGTDDGGLNLIRKEKNDFKIEVYNEKNGLSNNSVFDLIQNNDNSIWAATLGGGINVLNRKNQSIEINSLDVRIPSSMLLCFAKDASGSIWVGSYDAGAFKIEKQTVSQTYSTADGLTSNTIWDILCSKNGDIWMGTTENGINRIKANDGKVNLLTYSKQEGLPGDQILSLFEDIENNIWIGTNGAGICLSTGDHFSHYFEKAGLFAAHIQGIDEDEFGNLWLASAGGGIARLKFANNKVETQVFDEKNGFVSNNTSCIASGNSNNGNVWIGTVSKGIVKFDGKRFYNYTEKDGLLSDRVYSLHVDSKGIVWIGTAEGISRYDGVKFLNISTEKMQMENDGVKAIVEDKLGNIWFGTSGGLARYTGEGSLRTFDEKEGLAFKDVNALAEDASGNLWIGTNSGGIYKFDISKNDTCAISFVGNDSVLSSNSIRSLVFIDQNTLLSGTFNGFDKINIDQSGRIKNVKYYSASDGFLGVECNDNAICLDKSGNIWFGTVKGLTKFSPANEKKEKTAPLIQLTKLQLFYKDVDWKDKADTLMPWFQIPYELTLPYSENHITFKFSGVSFANTERIRFRYMLVGRDNDWSPAKTANDVTYTGIEPGTYKFKVQAFNEEGVWSSPVEYSLIITPPWYRTKWFYISSIFLILLSVWVFIRYREKKLRKEKEVLERIVAERTAEVVREKQIVEEQKHEIQEKHKEITDSINYAERIQKSFMATKDLLDEHLTQDGRSYFVLFKPKDVVSGDFYWAGKLSNGLFALATADSTGHGVPGAIMSLLNITSIEKAIEYHATPSDILNHTRNTIIGRLKKDGSAEGGKDGMDCSLCAYDFQQKKLFVAAANNPVWIVRSKDSEKEVIEIKPEKMPVGKHDRQDTPFTHQEIDLMQGDIVYTLTDGFPDQFGGEKGKKFMSKNLREFIASNAHLTMEEQKEHLHTKFVEWVGHHEQIDDVTVIGVRV